MESRTLTWEDPEKAPIVHIRAADMGYGTWKHSSLSKVLSSCHVTGTKSISKREFSFNLPLQLTTQLWQHFRVKNGSSPPTGKYCYVNDFRWQEEIPPWQWLTARRYFSRVLRRSGMRNPMLLLMPETLFFACAVIIVTIHNHRSPVDADSIIHTAEIWLYPRDGIMQ